MLVLWLVIPVFFWGSYYQFTRGSITRHIGFLHYILYFFSIYLGSYQIYVENGSVNDRFMISVMLYPILAFLGMLLAQGIGKRTSFKGGQIVCNLRERTLVVWTVLFFVGIYGIYLYSLGSGIPLLGLLMGGEAVESRLARYLATKGYTGEGVGGLHLFFWLPRILIDYFASFTVIFAYYWMRARGYGYLRFAAIFAGMGLLTLLQVEKYPAVKLGAMLALCHFNFKHVRVGVHSIMAGVWLSICGVLFAGLVYGIASGAYFNMADTPITEKFAFTAKTGWAILTTRGIFGQSQPLYVIYEIIPHNYDFFGGRTLTNPRGILPYQAITLPYLVYDSYNVSDPGVQGSDPTVFFGEVYANWGLAVSFVCMILFGFIVQTLQHVIALKIDRIRTPFYMAFFYVILLYLADFALGFSTLYFDERLWFFVALCIMRQCMVQYQSTVPHAVPA